MNKTHVAASLIVAMTTLVACSSSPSNAPVDLPSATSKGNDTSGTFTYNADGSVTLQVVAVPTQLTFQVSYEETGPDQPLVATGPTLFVLTHGPGTITLSSLNEDGFVVTTAESSQSFSWAQLGGTPLNGATSDEQQALNDFAAYVSYAVEEFGQSTGVTPDAFAIGNIWKCVMSSLGFATASWAAYGACAACIGAVGATVPTAGGSTIITIPACVACGLLTGIGIGAITTAIINCNKAKAEPTTTLPGVMN